MNFIKKINNKNGNKDRKKDNIDNNIFKKVSDYDSSCYMINFKCKQNCYCERNKDGIKKICFDKDIYNHETSIYLDLLMKKANITPFISPLSDEEIIYITSDYISLREFLNNKKDKYNKKDNKDIYIILNEVFCFVNTFQKYNFVHGNLHIDNIFIQHNAYVIKNIYIIDLSNSYFIDHNRISNCNYKRTSFLEEYDTKENTNSNSFVNEKILKYWDFFSLYISLNLYFGNLYFGNLSKTYLHNIISNYIVKSHLDSLLEQYNNLLNNIIVKNNV